MTRKDYVALAGALANVRPDPFDETMPRPIARATWVDSVIAIAAVLASDNPRFDRNRFIRACEGEKS